MGGEGRWTGISEQLWQVSLWGPLAVLLFLRNKGDRRPMVHIFVVLFPLNDKVLATQGRHRCNKEDNTEEIHTTSHRTRGAPTVVKSVISVG